MTSGGEKLHTAYFNAADALPNIAMFLRENGRLLPLPGDMLSLRAYTRHNKMMACVLVNFFLHMSVRNDQYDSDFQLFVI